MALAAYRHLLRATRVAFNGDIQLLHASRSQARQGFEDNRSMESASTEAGKAIEHAEGVAEILRTNVVQGRKGDGDSYSGYIALRIDLANANRTQHSQGYGARG
jgi:complex III assembly factor LYRM7